MISSFIVRFRTAGLVQRQPGSAPAWFGAGLVRRRPGSAPAWFSSGVIVMRVIVKQMKVQA
jgi:hypothetical protein